MHLNTRVPKGTLRHEKLAHVGFVVIWAGTTLLV